MKIKKRYIIIPIVIAILIVAIGAGIVLLDRISQKKQIEKDEKNYGNNYQKLNFDYELYNNECKNFIVNKFTQNTKETFGHIKNKMLVFCGEEDNQIGFSGNKVQNSKSYIFIKYYGYVQYFLLIVFSLLTVIINVKESKFYNTKNNLYQTQILFEIVFILYFCAHLLIEVQPRYRYDQYLMLAFIASPSIYLLFSIISSKYNKKDKEV